MAEDAQDIESQIRTAMRSRVGHFKEQADSLTFEGVRRLLEKDLGLETYALDVQKRYVKQCLLECLDGADDDNASKNSGETGENVCTTKGEAGQSPEGHELKKDVKETVSEDEEKMEDSPVMGLLTANKPIKSKPEETHGNKEVPNESTIKKAIRKRASYVKANSEKVTMAGLRRLLEEDLELDKHTLDPFKKFISEQLEEVLNSGEVESPTGVQKKTIKKNSQTKAPKNVSNKESSDSSDSESEEEEKRPKNKMVQKRKMQKSEGLGKRKRPAKEIKVPSKKWIKHAEKKSEDNTDAEDSEGVSEDGQSESSAEEKPVKKKEVSAPAYGKEVERLKSVIKLCGLSIPPSVYKKVKQVHENKRETCLVKELEEILSKEGLSANPSEKEIKEVRRKKERAKELEGIDMSNIVLSSRRRSTTSFIAPPPPPPKPKVPVESDEEGSEHTDEDEEDNDDDDDDDEEDEEDGDDGNDDDSQSEEELNDDNEDSD